MTMVIIIIISLVVVIIIDILNCSILTANKIPNTFDPVVEKIYFHQLFIYQDMAHINICEYLDNLC